jgi:hypothetical protein
MLLTEKRRPREKGFHRSKENTAMGPMGMLYWFAVWVFMIGAFVGAWSFIVKGCEAMDIAHPPEGEEPAADHGHH